MTAAPAAVVAVCVDGIESTARIDVPGAKLLQTWKHAAATRKNQQAVVVAAVLRLLLYPAIPILQLPVLPADIVEISQFIHACNAENTARSACPHLDIVYDLRYTLV